MSLSIAVLTVSDRSARGEREDLGGPAVSESATRLFDEGAVITHDVVPDEREAIASALRRLAAENVLVLTTGGTGITDRDVTVEATRDVIDFEIPGLGEEMRRRSVASVPAAVLSRAIAGRIGTAIVVNLPGRPEGAVECLEHAASGIRHGLKLLANPGVDVHTDPST